MTKITLQLQAQRMVEELVDPSLSDQKNGVYARALIALQRPNWEQSFDAYIEEIRESMERFESDMRGAWQVDKGCENAYHDFMVYKELLGQLELVQESYQPVAR